MTINELHRNFKLELDKSDSLNYPNYEPEEIDYWLNSAVRELVKTRYTGQNIKGESFQQTQKRSDDLRTVVATVSIPAKSTSTGYKRAEYSFDYPSDYWFTVAEEPILYSTAVCWPKDDAGNALEVEGEVIEKTLDTYKSELTSPLSDVNLHYGKGKPIRVQTDGIIKFYTDGLYDVKSIALTYIKEPDVIDYYANPNLSYDYMPEHMHDEIVRVAVRRALENIAEPRYQTYPGEVITME